MEFWQAFLFAIALSFDGLGVGVAYGLKGMIVPIKARLLVAFVSICVITTALFLGNILRLFLPLEFSKVIGRLIFFLVGLWFLLQAWLRSRTRKKENGRSEQNIPLVEFSLKSLGVVILVLRHPASADFDDSGTISVSEAVFLGLALAMDAFGAGIGASMGSNWPLYTPIIVGLVKFTFLSGGLLLGEIWNRRQTLNGINPVFNYLPGVILFIIAITGF